MEELEEPVPLGIDDFQMWLSELYYEFAEWQNVFELYLIEAFASGRPITVIHIMEVSDYLMWKYGANE